MNMLLFVVNVWEKIKMKTMKDYCGAILLSVDVFQKFRNNSLKKSLSHYLNAPGLSWDVML